MIAALGVVLTALSPRAALLGKTAGLGEDDGLVRGRALGSLTDERRPANALLCTREEDDAMECEIIAEGLIFPEGPVWMQDGSVLVVEVGAGRITRIRADGRKETVAEPGGGPNGAAIGPDGALYVCNNGGMIFFEFNGGLLTRADATPEYANGSIQRIDIATGKVDTLYEDVDGRRLAGPNDIVFDAHGGFWFSDLGKHIGHTIEIGGIFYAHPDGTRITRVVDGVGANGIGLSPDGLTLYAALSRERQILAYDVVRPGELDLSDPFGGRVLASFPGRRALDSLAVAADGTVCVAVLPEESGISSVSPEGKIMGHVAFPDLMTTNICFGGADMRDAYVTLSSSGRLAYMRWQKPGLKLPYNV